MSKLELSDFNKICRMCLKEDSTLINIFFSDAAELISEITSIRLSEGDFLPENICIPCMDKSTEFYKFKELCEKNSIKLQSILTLNNAGDHEIYDLKKIIPAILKHDDNQKENDVKIELSGNIKNEPEVKPDKVLNRDNQVDQSVVQSELEACCSENQTISADLNISIPLKNRHNRKIQIKRRYKDLIPLEAYNNQKIIRDAGKTQSRDAQVLADISTEQVNVEKLEVQNEEIYNEFQNEEIVEMKDETELEGLMSENETEKSLCEHCNVEFDQIQMHLEEYHPAGGTHYCYICSKLSSSVYSTVKQLQAHLKYHKQLPKFQCEVCDRWFRYKYQRMVHMRLHTGERPAVCDICDKSFRDPRYLAIHLKSHADERPYKCTVCEKGFSHKFSLKVHMKTHSTEREHMCSMCGKTFIYGHNLTIHLRQHTGEKPYSCHLCFNSFISCSVLRAHMLTHSDQKRFECKVCGKRFKRTGDLNVHMRSHTGEKPYACTLCSNKYKMSSHLTEHMKTHTGEKNYVCEICSKSFYNNKSLQVHKNTHSGQKIYNCQDCDKSFVHHTSLCAHQRKQHKK